MANYNSSYTGAQIDSAVGKANNPDSTPTANSGNLITSGGVAAAIAAALGANVGGIKQSVEIAPNTETASLTPGVYYASAETASTLPYYPSARKSTLFVFFQGPNIGRIQVCFDGINIYSRVVGAAWRKFSGEVVPNG